MNKARRLADLGATVAVIHHSGKADSSTDFRGSSDFKASVDVAFHVTNLSSDGKLLDRVTLRCFKSRYGFTGSIVYHYDGGRFVRDGRTDAPQRTASDQLTSILRRHPDLAGDAFEKLAADCGISRNRARTFLLDGVDAGLIKFRPDGRARRYRLDAENA